MLTRARTKILAALSTTVIALGLVAVTAGHANAHTPNVVATCSDLTVNLTKYRSDRINTVIVTIDGTQVDSDSNFGRTFSQNYTFSDRSVAHDWSVVYTAGDDPNGTRGYSGTKHGTTVPCVVDDATAQVSFVDATCGSAQKLVLGATTHADWGEIVYSGVDNRDFKVTATATLNHRFANGDEDSHGATKTFRGTLDAATGSCPPPPCLPKSAVTFTYDSTTNSGVITVAPKSGYSNELCTKFWVSAASWTFDGNTKWPQTLDLWNPAHDGNAISTVGTYPYGAEVGCGQGDIYGSFSSPGVPKPSTDAGILTGPNQGYIEHFLSGMGFRGASTPTYMVRDAATCHTTLVERIPVVTFIDRCGTAEDRIVGGVDTEAIDYTVKDNRINHVGVGSISVSAVPKTGYVFADGAYTGPWEYTFTSLDCPVVFTHPSAVDQTCGGVVAGLVDGSITVDLSGNLPHQVSYRISGDTIDFTATRSVNTLPPGDYTVTIAAKSGFLLDATQQSVWQFTIVAANLCTQSRQSFISTTATSTPLTCGSPGSYTLTNTEGVIWYAVVNGVKTVTTPGTHTVNDVSTVNVSAEKVARGVDWQDGAQTEWTFNFNRTEACLRALASTGSSGFDRGLLVAFGLLLIGGTALVSCWRIRINSR